MTLDEKPGNNSNILAQQISSNKDAIVNGIKRFADLVGDLTKIWLLISVTISMLFIGNYLAQFDIPFIPLDNILPAIVSIFAIIFVCVAILTTTYIVFPLTLKYMVSFEVMKALPQLFPVLTISNANSEPSHTFSLRRFFLEYLQFYLPLITIDLSFLAFILFSFNYKIDTTVLILVLVISFMIGLYWNISKVRHLFISSPFQNDVVYWFLISNLSIISWVTVINLVAIRFAAYNIQYESSAIAERLIGETVLFLVYLLHFLLSIANYDRSGRVLMMICCLIVLGACYSFGFGYIGGLVLRIAGLGGGTALNFRVDHNPPTKGCLVWPQGHSVLP